MGRDSFSFGGNMKHRENDIWRGIGRVGIRGKEALLETLGNVWKVTNLLGKGFKEEGLGIKRR